MRLFARRRDGGLQGGKQMTHPRAAGPEKHSLRLARAWRGQLTRTRRARLRITVPACSFPGIVLLVLLASCSSCCSFPFLVLRLRPLKECLSLALCLNGIELRLKPDNPLAIHPRWMSTKAYILKGNEA